VPRGAHRERLSRTSYVPLYYQLAVVLEERIESGEYAPGEDFPSEHELCREFGVSRTVVRPAIGILEREGRVTRHQGMRTLVGLPKTLSRPGGLLRTLIESELHDELDVRLLEIGREPGASETAALLGLKSGEHMLRIAAVAAVGRVPSAIHWSFLAERRFPWIASLRPGQSLTGAEAPLRRLALGRSEILVESSWCTEFEARELSIPVGSPVLVARGTETAGGRARPSGVVEVCWVVYGASTSRLRLALEPVQRSTPETPKRSDVR
jgi:GntR family transcriptional regulator